MIRHGFRVRRARLFNLLLSLVVTIILVGTGHYMWAIVAALLAAYWAYEFNRMHQAIRKVKASPVYYLLLVQDEFGGRP